MDANKPEGVEPVEGEPGRFRNILVATDGSPNARRAVGVAGDLARRLGARLTVLTVKPLMLAPVYGIGFVPPAPFEEEILRKHAESVVHEQDGSLREMGLSPEHRIREGNPAEVIAGESREFDLLVIGGRGHGAMHALLLGSVSERLGHLAKTNLLVVH